MSTDVNHIIWSLSTVFLSLWFWIFMRCIFSSLEKSVSCSVHQFICQLIGVYNPRFVFFKFLFLIGTYLLRCWYVTNNKISITCRSKIFGSRTKHLMTFIALSQYMLFIDWWNIFFIWLSLWTCLFGVDLSMK